MKRFPPLYTLPRERAALHRALLALIILATLMCLSDLFLRVRDKAEEQAITMYGDSQQWE